MFSGNIKLVESYLWLPIIIGPIEVFLSLYCCFRCVCNVKFESISEFYDTIIILKDSYVLVFIYIYI